MIQIAVINESTAYTAAQVQAMIGALWTQWDRDLAPVWNLESATFVFIPKGEAPAPEAWWCVFLDDSDQAGALAYHDVTNEGLPIAKIFVKTILSDSSSVSVGASHEVCEMAVDPTINLSAQDSNGLFWAYEVCDPVEDDSYGYDIGDVLVSDFVTPAWFGYPSSAGKPLDFQKKCSTPFQVLTGGYAQSNNGSGWTQTTGKLAARYQRIMTPPAGSRRARRLRGRGSITFKKSAHVF